ncbi:Zinc finger protein CONSTANS-LIKE 3 [Camellia lanceoleosa]|uniref:Zinc finger protein CONSTANS-LIKE 3 n=1 Tax=Camellia lanceoleosa TaxID=1840588 RepID=A0ACC0HFS0_9ERIC|nr:Zinc finger protein CONSTANS-LIKE 3 [Camellia lanceoleosa]
MASILPKCQYHPSVSLDSDYIFCNQFCEEFPPPFAAAKNNNINGCAATALWAEDNNDALPLFDMDMVPPETNFSDMVVVPVLPPPPPKFNTGLHLNDIANATGTLSFQLQMEECCNNNGFVPVYGDNNRGDFQVPLVPALIEEQEEPTMKVGRYSVEERKNRILRYINKRNQRNFNKTIKYACRKILADKRVRVRGRFARNNELLSEEEASAVRKNNDNNPQENHDREFYKDTLKIKHDGEDWFQEAMASLMCLPYISG